MNRFLGGTRFLPAMELMMARSPDELLAHEPISMLNLKGETTQLWDEINAAIQRVLRSGQFILGPEVEAFEEEVADFLGVKYAIGVNSGTDALVIGLRALGIGPGDEVITTPFTFFATTEAILHVGATPVFVDIDEATFNIDPALIEEAISARSKAILPVHLFGRPAPMETIMEIAQEHGLKVIEDAAQSFGAAARASDVVEEGSSWDRMTGAVADVGAFSFYPTKTLGAYGDAGLVVTDDDALAERARQLRNHGEALDRRYVSTTVGYNSRLDALQAAILRVKLPHVRGANARRREAAARYDELLTGRSGIRPPEPTDSHVYHQYTVRLEGGDRDRVREALAARSISTAVYYPVPTSRMAHPAVESGAIAASERACAEVLSLPLWPGISLEHQERVAFELTQVT